MAQGLVFTFRIDQCYKYHLLTKTVLLTRFYYLACCVGGVPQGMGHICHHWRGWSGSGDFYQTISTCYWPSVEGNSFWRFGSDFSRVHVIHSQGRVQGGFVKILPSLLHLVLFSRCSFPLLFLISSLLVHLCVFPNFKPRFPPLVKILPSPISSLAPHPITSFSSSSSPPPSPPLSLPSPPLPPPPPLSHSMWPF